MRTIKKLFITFLIMVLSMEMPLSVYAESPLTKELSENDIGISTEVPLDEEHFPDEIFRNYLQEMFDADMNGSLSESEIAEASAMDISGMNISSIEGIGYFTGLKSLDCSFNRLSQLYPEKLTALSELKADHNAYLFIEEEIQDSSLEEKEIYTEITFMENPQMTAVELYTQETFSEIAIDEEHFPDEVFRDYVKTRLDTDCDGVLSEEEIKRITVIDVSHWGIADLTGIAYFKNLVFLNYADNDLESPDLSENIYLLEAVSTEEEETEFVEITEKITDVTDEGEPEQKPDGIPEAEEAFKIEEAAGVFSAVNESDSVSDNSTLLLEEADEERAAKSGNDTTVSGDDLVETVTEEQEAPFTVGTPKLSTVKNNAKGKASISFSACTNASGYEVEYCRKSGFTKDVVTVQSQKTSLIITNLPKNKTYYFRVRAYGIDKEGKKIYSSYSNVLSVKINKGVDEQKYSSSAGKVKTCKIVNKNTFSFKANVKKRVTSSDDSYYLCQVDPYTNKRVRTIATVGKTTSVTVSLPVKDENGMNLIEGKYALFIKSSGKYKIITNATYISNPEAAATYTAAFPKSDSKKGLQGALGKTDLGVSHSLINIQLTDVIAPDGQGVPYEYNGKTYYFKPSPYTGVIRYCNEHNVTISAVFLLPWSDSLKSLITSKGRKAGAANYYAWNTSTQASRETLEATFMYLAELYSRENCHLDNWILGNEANAGYAWHYAGKMSYKDYIENYAQSFRLMYYAAVSHNKNARVYISLTHTWMRNGREYGAKDFMTDFNKEIKAEQKNIKWNLAYHAYPAPLTSPAFWNNSNAENHENAVSVTPKNLSVLTNFVKKKFGKKTRIILSEQGFTSTQGEDIQAAAIAYAYYIAEFNDMIDSFIIRSDIDNEVETAQGLKMGLCDINGKQKLAYNVFKYMDTPQYKTYTKGCLGTLNKSSWKNLVKGFKESLLKKMPNR